MKEEGKQCNMVLVEKCARNPPVQGGQALGISLDQQEEAQNDQEKLWVKLK